MSVQAIEGRKPTLASALWPITRETGAARAIVLMVLGSVVIWVSAKVQIPWQPVPLTMQTFAVLALGVAYGARLGLATVLLYLAQGAAGLPVFAGDWSEGGGFHHLYGPTGGYLVGFAVAAGVCGWLAERGWDRSALWAAAAMVIGNLIIYALGLLWLCTQIDIVPAIEVGLLPFLTGDALKIALGACLLPGAWYLLGKRGR